LTRAALCFFAISLNPRLGFIAPGAGSPDHELIVPFLRGRHQSFVLRFCDSPD